VELIYLAVNVSAIRAFRTGFRDDFRICRHPLMSATAIVFLLFPFWGFFTRARVTTFPDSPTGWSHEFRRF